MAGYKFLTPQTLRSGVVLKNRIVIPPMTDTNALRDGSISDNQLKYFERHSGGAGLFITPVANVDATGKGFEGELSVANDTMIPGLTKLARAMHQNGTKAILQIFSAGRMTDHTILRGLKPVSASAVAYPYSGMEIPHALTTTEIEQTIAAFGAATSRAIRAGFDGVEIHGANRFLIQQFFSPHSNQRTDVWGGSVVDRMRFPLAVVDAVQAVVQAEAPQNFAVGYRISPEESHTPGITMTETLQLVEKLVQKRLDYLHVSLTQDVWRTPFTDDNDQTPVIKQIQAATGEQVPLIVLGGLKQPDEVERVIQAGFDMAALGHESLLEPDWVEKVMAGREDEIKTDFKTIDYTSAEIDTPFRAFIRYVDGETGDVY